MKIDQSVRLIAFLAFAASPLAATQLSTLPQQETFAEVVEIHTGTNRFQSGPGRLWKRIRFTDVRLKLKGNVFCDPSPKDYPDRGRKGSVWAPFARVVVRASPCGEDSAGNIRVCEQVVTADGHGRFQADTFVRIYGQDDRAILTIHGENGTGARYYLSKHGDKLWLSHYVVISNYNQVKVLYAYTKECPPGIKDLARYDGGPGQSQPYEPWPIDANPNRPTGAKRYRVNSSIQKSGESPESALMRIAPIGSSIVQARDRLEALGFGCYSDDEFNVRCIGDIGYILAPRWQPTITSKDGKVASIKVHASLF